MAITPLPPNKPGYKTTEFWLTVIVDVGALIAGSGALSGDADDPIVKAMAFAAMILATLGYQAARTFTKKSNGNP